MTDTTDLLQDGASAPAAQDNPATAGAAPRTRRRATSSGLPAMVLPELQALAGELGISGVGRLRKSQLIEAIQAAQAGAADAAAPVAADAPVADAPAEASAPTRARRGARAAAGPPAAPSGGATAGAEASSGTATSASAPTSDRDVRTRAGRDGGDLEARDGGARDGGARDGGARDGGARDGGARDSTQDDDGRDTRDDGRDRSSRERGGPDRDGRDRDASEREAPDGGRAASDRDDDGQDDGQGDDGDRPERVDRGRERFLEREARRQERAAQAAEDSGDGSRADRGPRNDRSQGDRPQGDRSQGDRPQGDRSQGDRSQGDRTPYDRDRQRTPQADRSQGDRQQPADRQQGDRQQADRQQGDSQGLNGPRDDDDLTGRRGRFRERGRGRNRTGGRDRFGAEPDPVLSDDDVLVPVGGILDILDNYGFVRTTGYLTGPSDVYVSLQQVRKYGLRRGDAVTGAVRQQREGERKDKYNALVRLDSVNGLDPSEAHKRPDFTKLTPLYPQDRLRLETDASVLTTRVIDLVMPVGKGQRALIVSPPKAGKTMVLQAIANAITTNNPECHLMVVLVDERPEEVTDMQRSVKGEVIASTFDRPPQDHITVAELSIERAKRLVELGHDVVVLLDSITRLGRAYNLGAPASGRILTGGVDSAALYPPKRFLGAARNIENGGSLTIFATALVETGSAMDTVIFEEFKGTGNAELKLDRRLADKRIFPAIDVDASGTRKEEILLSPEELRIVLSLRRVLHALDATASLELLLDKMKKTRTNVEFLMQIQKTTPGSE